MANRQNANAPVGLAPASPQAGSIMFPGTPLGEILETDYVNTPLPDRRGDWPKRAAGGETFLSLGGPSHGWINIHDPGNQYDTPLTGLSGTIVNEPHVSTSDLPFLHPFTNDFEFHVAPDEAYRDLAAPKMIDAEYKKSTAAANAMSIPVKGVVGMEMDSRLIPKGVDFRVKDRVCIWGRWIVDAGHQDFHTEIHPPLLMVRGRPGKSAQQKNRTVQRLDATTVQIVSRPYLVSQEFDDGALLEHLVKEVAKIMSPVPLSWELEARPRLMPKPFEGQNIMMFKIRPPSGRLDPLDEIVVTYSVARNSGSTAIQILRGTDGESVRVVIVLNDAGYNPPPEPKKVSYHVTLAELEAMDPDAAPYIKAGAFVSMLADPLFAPYILNKGVQTYKFPEFDKNVQVLGPQRSFSLQQLHAVHEDPISSNVYPVLGTINVEWNRFQARSDGRRAASTPAPPGP